MPTSNENLARADITISQLASDGGRLSPQQAETFIDMVTEEPTILQQVRTIRMNRPEVQVNSLGFADRILRAARNAPGLAEEDDGSNGRYVRKVDRVAPVTATVTLTSKELIAECRIPYEVLEDNIEGQSMEAHVMRLMAQRASLDLEEYALWADTASSDPYLALTNGWMKLAGTGNVVDNLNAGITPDMFSTALLSMPQKYLRLLPQLRAYVSMANTIRYRAAVSARQTGYGDSALQNNIALQAYGLQIEGAPSMVMNGGANDGLITFPKNLIWGIRRDITVETDKDIRSREYIIVLTLRAGVGIDDANATVALKNI